jgi:hypothetical protein
MFLTWNPLLTLLPVVAHTGGATLQLSQIALVVVAVSEAAYNRTNRETQNKSALP